MNVESTNKPETQPNYFVIRKKQTNGMIVSEIISNFAP